MTAASYPLPQPLARTYKIGAAINSARSEKLGRAAPAARVTFARVIATLPCLTAAFFFSSEALQQLSGFRRRAIERSGNFYCCDILSFIFRMLTIPRNGKFSCNHRPAVC